MPLVFSENEATESGISYDDDTGVSYQFPKMYRRIILPGLAFVYYRGRKRAGGRQLQVYFGMGIVGSVTGDTPDRLRCEVLNYRPFDSPVPFKQGRSGYLEIGGQRKGYFQRGVRSISEAEFAKIADVANIAASAPEDVAMQNTTIRMAKTAVRTAANANGQAVVRRIKNKLLPLTPSELSDHIRNLLDMQSGRCAITGIPLQLDGKCDDVALLCSLDRIDSEAHYTIDNLQVVCRFVNKWKGAENDLEFRRLVGLLRKPA
ncbi:hypothetical protein SAMN05444171_4059 [Bradyrhizobium lablabi]|uniref:Uncharacterized protein n=2 Tax=Bradyrhizobium TaxID=374 RepID=A0ABY0PK08_9BRAD|nr:hypothetical protein SAMN05444163_3110 [Bradyrhizobium ottawaense]SED42000.1 hypothetical protein SAMN05444171_4059 [Bradyrhizobium lablabi]